MVLQQGRVTVFDGDAVAFLEHRDLELGGGIALGDLDRGLAVLTEGDRRHPVLGRLLLTPCRVRNDVEHVDDVVLGGRLIRRREDDRQARTDRCAADELPHRGVRRQRDRKQLAVRVSGIAQPLPRIAVEGAQCVADVVAVGDRVTLTLADHAALRRLDLLAEFEARAGCRAEVTVDLHALSGRAGIDGRGAEVARRGVGVVTGVAAFAGSAPCQQQRGDSKSGQSDERACAHSDTSDQKGNDSILPYSPLLLLYDVTPTPFRAGYESRSSLLG